MAITYEVHPAIGIARLGASREFFVGPEPNVALPTKYRDAQGALLRQAARFRIFRCNRDARGVLQEFAEITLADASIEWTVEIANRKGTAPKIVGPGRRNSATGDDAKDAAHLILPTAKRLNGSNAFAVFDDGAFDGSPVSLGEARTDADGRLNVVGAVGQSASPRGTKLIFWAENDGWFDNVADGSVKAVIKLNSGEQPSVLGAWVISAPPDFAPALQNMVTLYDTLWDVAVARGFVQNQRLPDVPATPAWDVDIWPLLARALAYQWVSQAAQSNHGPGQRGDFTSSDWAGIDDPAQPNQRRQDIFRLLRQPGSVPHHANAKAMPRLFSDEYLTQGQNQDRLPLTTRQYEILNRWQQGKFTKSRAADSELLPDAITRVALEACVGGAFVPGIEVTYTVRDHSSYMAGEPFRLSHATVRPGSVTQSMAVPWQTDFTDCGWDDRYQMAWWPAQRPTEVFDGLAATTMVDWLAGFPGGMVDSWTEMIAHWSELGIVVERTIDGKPRFVQVERAYPVGPGGGPLSVAAILAFPPRTEGIIRKFEETRRTAR